MLYIHPWCPVCGGLSYPKEKYKYQLQLITHYILVDREVRSHLPLKSRHEDLAPGCCELLELCRRQGGGGDGAGGGGAAGGGVVHFRMKESIPSVLGWSSK